jgi:gamma-glutamylcyclotransferase (GGCT)/AIG2-like uncharacterized protein YtfP
MDTPSIHHLFVYASLRSGFHNPAYRYISDFFMPEGEAITGGCFYDRGNYPVAIPDTAGRHILGELYRIKDLASFPWVLEQLDDYEGLNTEAGEKPLYRRAVTTVMMLGKPINAWVYWYDGDTTGLPVIQTGDILHYLQGLHKP